MTTRITIPRAFGMTVGTLIRVQFRWYVVKDVHVEGVTISAVPWWRNVWLKLRDRFRGKYDSRT